MVLERSGKRVPPILAAFGDVRAHRGRFVALSPGHFSRVLKKSRYSILSQSWGMPGYGPNGET